MNEQERDELLDTILEQYHIVKHIKNRCHNATPEDMEQISLIVKAYNRYTGMNRLRASACSVPHIVDLTSKLLVGKGKLERNERGSLSNIQ